MAKYGLIVLLGLCSLTIAEDSGLAVNLPFILFKSSDGSISKEDLSASPNKSLPIEEKHVKFFFYTKKVNGTQFGKNNISIIDFDSTKETVFVTHGWQNSHLSPMSQTVKDAYLKAKDVNVVVVDWNDIAKRDYVNARYAITKVGRIIAKLIEYMVNNVGLKLANTALVGHSLGAHISGVAGYNLDGAVDHLVGLDPAGPLFYTTNSKDKLDSTDAKFVQIIHSCPGILGYPFSLGDADYWPNGRSPSQPGCGLDPTGSCAHSRSYQYYAESLTNGTFLAKKCGNEILYKLGACKNSKEATMGNDAIDRSTGNFYLYTNSDLPYAKSSGN